MAGVSTRTLRYYDEIGLLAPARVADSGYRMYGETEVDALQQILFYRALGVELLKIKALLHTESFDKTAALESHLTALLEKRSQLDTLILNASRTISAMKGETTMTDREKFEGFKQKMLEENERLYGAELDEKYGHDAIAAFNCRIKEMTFERYSEAEQLEAEVKAALASAIQNGDPAGEPAQKACALHEKWL
ncbi:MAG: MerR family transcriptional regulator, partial [Oscillospiraceae bacterium]